MINGYAEIDDFGKVQVDDPAQFHASISLGYAGVVLEGVHADSYALGNDMLFMYRGDYLVDSVRYLPSTIIQTPLATSA